MPDKAPTYLKVKTRFGNRAVLKPIRMSDMQIKHQLDLTDLQRIIQDTNYHL